MTKTLHDLYQGQQALDLAETPAEAVQALRKMLEPLLSGATVSITLDTDSEVPELAPYVVEAIKTQEPQLNSKGNGLAVQRDAGTAERRRQRRSGRGSGRPEIPPEDGGETAGRDRSCVIRQTDDASGEDRWPILEIRNRVRVQRDDRKAACGH